MSGHVIAYAGGLIFYHNILCFFCRSVQFYKKNKQTKQNKNTELNSNMHNGFKLIKKINISLLWSWLDWGLDGINMEF